jgi:hypothetical protein
VSFQFAGMAITTLEKRSDAGARRAHEMRLMDYVRDPKDFPAPPAERVQTLRQEEYEAFPETPFFVGVPREIFEAAKSSQRVRDVARGRVERRLIGGPGLANQRRGTEGRNRGQQAALGAVCERIVAALKADPDADVAGPRGEIDEAIFDLFEIRGSREEVRRFFETVGKVEKGEAQAASE